MPLSADIHDYMTTKITRDSKIEIMVYFDKNAVAKTGVLISSKEEPKNHHQLITVADFVTLARGLKNEVLMKIALDAIRQEEILNGFQP